MGDDKPKDSAKPDPPVKDPTQPALGVTPAGAGGAAGPPPPAPGESVDLDDPDAQGSTASAADDVRLADYNPEPVRDQVRGQIALYLIGILALMVLASFTLLYAAPWHTEKLVTVLQILFGPVATLVGAATGYYFGANSSQKPK